MTTTVKYPLAKLLKDKGFVFRQNETYYNPVNGFTKYEEITPTIAEVVMWLYGRYWIWIEVRYMDDIANFGMHITTIKDNTEQVERYYFKSPTKAYEAAIEYVLTHLI